MQTCDFVKRETLTQVFFCEFWEITKNTSGRLLLKISMSNICALRLRTSIHKFSGFQKHQTSSNYWNWSFFIMCSDMYPVKTRLIFHIPYFTPLETYFYDSSKWNGLACSMSLYLFNLLKVKVTSPNHHIETQSIDLQSKSIDWFLYKTNFGL